MKANFARKLRNLKELEMFTLDVLEHQSGFGDSYFVAKEIKLEDEDFKAFSEDFFKEWDWLTEEDGGLGPRGYSCVKVINSKTGDAVLVNNEGFNYARYVALPDPTDTIISDIAKTILRVETLETRGSDVLDFHEVSVWSLKEALELAFAKGKHGKHPIL